MEELPVEKNNLGIWKSKPPLEQRCLMKAFHCTGGIRCEKASSFLLSKGFKEVYHLEGGILKYLEEVPKTESLWEGECFVFDKRVSVEHGLEQGTFKLCYGCKQPSSLTVTYQNLRKKKREQEHDKDNLRLGESLVVLTKVADQH